MCDQLWKNIEEKLRGLHKQLLLELLKCNSCHVVSYSNHQIESELTSVHWDLMITLMVNDCFSKDLNI